MTIYLYSRYSPRNRAYSENLAILQAAAPGSKHFEDKVRGCVPPEERNAFQQLFTALQPGDTVVIWWLSTFGRDFSQALNTIRLLLDKQVTLQTVCEPMSFKPGSAETHTMLTLLTGYGKVQTQHRLFAAEQGRKAIKDQPDVWKQKFRGRPANKDKHQKIAALLLEGNTLRSVAEQCEVSLSTVKRIKTKLNDFDDEGGLRTRGKAGLSDGEPS